VDVARVDVNNRAYQHNMPSKYDYHTRAQLISLLEKRDQLRRLKELEKENLRLRRAVSDLVL